MLPFPQTHLRSLLPAVAAVCFILSERPGAEALPPVTPADLATVRELNASFNRRKSRVMVRHVDEPTRARLDVAAYDRNPLMRVPRPPEVKVPSPRPKLPDLTFHDSLVPGTLRDRLTSTPLTKPERREPLAVEPLLDYLANWDYDASEKLLLCAASVTEEKWGNTEVVPPLQQLTLFYLHHTDQGVELWTRIEFAPWAAFVVGVTDEDKDGYPEAYGQVRADALPKKVLRQVESDYLTRVLTPAQVDTYFYELSSAWYEKLRTLTLKPAETHPWPNADTEPDIVKELGGRKLEHPTAVIRGTPYGKPLYNVFLVTWTGRELMATRPPAPSGAAVLAAVQWGAEPQARNVARWNQELKEWGGGSWAGWMKKLGPFRAAVKKQLAARPPAQKCLPGKDGFLFFRGSLEYLLAGDLRRQPDGRDPYPAIVDYDRQLNAKGIDMLLVVIPVKPEVFPEKVSAAAPRNGKGPGQPYVTPYTRKLLLELAEAGVESVDLLPAFSRHRDAGREPFYLPLDTHWSNTAVRLAAKLIAARVKQYPWYHQVCPKPLRYTTRGVAFTRTGDLRGMLPLAERVHYRPMKLRALQVIDPDGQPYNDDPTSPIVMLGDSFCGIYHYEDCQHAGLSAHVAKELGMPLDLLASQGSGPLIRAQLARRGHAALTRKKLVIWTVAARDLYHYRAPWKKIPVP